MPFERGCTNSPHRVIVNLTFERWKAAGCPASGSRPGEGERIGTFPDGAPMLRCNVSAPWETMDGDWEAGPLYSGTSAALINSVEPVGQLLARTSAESEAALRRSIDHLH
jgi:nitronate monooxygenase